MGAPNGGSAILFFKPEAVWGDGAGLSNAATTYRLYFDSFTAQNDRTPIEFKEIQGSAAAYDHVEFVEGGIELGGTLIYTARYSGMHALLNGICLGQLTTGGTTHGAELANDLPSIAIGWQPPTLESGVTDLDDFRFNGMMVQTATWSHRAGEPLKHSITFLGRDYAYDTTALASTSMAIQAEDIVQWHDKEIDSGADTGIEVEIQSATPVELNTTDWELTLDNNLVRRYLIQNGRYAAQPARDGKRTITLRMTIDKDDGWRAFMDAMGADSSTDTYDCDVRLRYEDNADSGLKWEALVANCRTISVPSAISDDGLVTETVELRAHYQTAGLNQSAPLTINVTNNDATDWGALI